MDNRSARWPLWVLAAAPRRWGGWHRPHRRRFPLGAAMLAGALGANAGSMIPAAWPTWCAMVGADVSIRSAIRAALALALTRSDRRRNWRPRAMQQLLADHEDIVNVVMVMVVVALAAAAVWTIFR